MRELSDLDRIERFMEALGREAETWSRVYLTGGTTAVLLGWRPTTLDIDVKLVPDADDLLRAIQRIKQTLNVNIELAAPDEFLPELPGWRERSVLIRQVRRLSFLHYDFYAQTLSKLERLHTKDLVDCEAMLERGLVEPEELWRLFELFEPELFRFPAVVPEELRRSVESFINRANRPR